MMNSKKTNDKYIFLDRDGTIIKDKGHMYKIEDIQFLPKAIDGLKKLQTLGYQFIIITNQAGIARKYYSLKDAKKFNRELIKRLRKKGLKIKKVYLCPHHPDFTGKCDCRKPEPGLVTTAQKELGVNLKKSIFIGDKDCDIELGKKYLGLTFLIKNKQYKVSTKADHVVNNIEEIFYKLSNPDIN